MTVGEVKNYLENSEDPIYVVAGEDQRARTPMIGWLPNDWDALPNALKIVFSDFSDRENFIDCLYEILLASKDNETVEELVSKIKIMENNCKKNLYTPNEKIYYCSETPESFWRRYPLRFYNAEFVEKYVKENERETVLISPKNLDIWLKYHPCQRVYMDVFNEDMMEQLSDEERKIILSHETISLYDDEKY